MALAAGGRRANR